MHRPFFSEEVALAALASLRWPLDPALLPGVYLIETARVGETVAAEYPVSGRNGLHDCRNGRRIHEGMCWGAAAKKRTARQPRKRRP